MTRMELLALNQLVKSGVAQRDFAAKNKEYERNRINADRNLNDPEADKEIAKDARLLEHYWEGFEQGCQSILDDLDVLVRAAEADERRAK